MIAVIFMDTLMQTIAIQGWARVYVVRRHGWPLLEFCYDGVGMKPRRSVKVKDIQQPNDYTSEMIPPEWDSELRIWCKQPYAF